MPIHRHGTVRVNNVIPQEQIQLKKPDYCSFYFFLLFLFLPLPCA